MIIGNLSDLALAGLPVSLRKILSRPDCSLEALSAREDGCWQPEDSHWFCNIGEAQTQPLAQRHTEYHHQWADIQVMLSGCEVINAGMLAVAHDDDEERKPDLFITQNCELAVTITLHTGDFAIFLPSEPHQALCVVDAPTTVRKAVFKIPHDLLEG